jgi:hypothetical protein
MLRKIYFETPSDPFGRFPQMRRLVQAHYDDCTKRLIHVALQAWVMTALSAFATSGV